MLEMPEREGKKNFLRGLEQNSDTNKTALTVIYKAKFAKYKTNRG